MNLNCPGYPEAAGDSPVERTAEHRLLSEMYAMACNNPRFRREEADQVMVSVSETTDFEIPDSLTPAQRAELRKQGQKTWPTTTSEIENTYCFYAQRFIPSDSKTGNTETGFILSASADHSSIPMPAYLARKITDLPPVEAVKAIGLVTLERGMTFKIATHIPHLDTCDHFMYKDSEDDVIWGGCTCEQEGSLDPFYLRLDPEADDEADSDTQVMERPGRQAILTSTVDRMNHEALVFDDPAAALASWAVADIPDIAIEESMYRENLKSAFATLHGFKQALRQQAGLR